MCTHKNSQAIFIDTPGIFSAEKNFEKSMVQAAWSSVGEADVVLLIIDAKRALRDGSLEIIQRLKEYVKKPVCLLLNKVDAVEKEKLFELAKTCSEQGNFARIFMISALKGDGVDDVVSYIADILPAHEWLYPDEQMSDISMRLLAAEITREKLFLCLEQELPYAVFVETESWEETDKAVKLSQVILVEREGQKKIVIGNKGEMLKTVS